MRKLIVRIAFGLAMIAVVAGVLALDLMLQANFYLKHLPLTILLIVVGVVAFREIARLAAAVGPAPLGLSGIIGTVAIATMPYWWQDIVQPLMPLGQGAFPFATATVLVALWLIFAEQMIRFRSQDAFRRIATTSLAVVYLGFGGAAILWLRASDRGSVELLVLFLVAVKCTDIGAYFVGSAIGRHKMIPWLSPGKSWEGLVGGLTAGGGASMLAAKLLAVCGLPIHGLSPAEAACFGAIVGGVGQFADLCESLLKRSAKLKDSGAAVPEFGGILDIIDSPLLAAPAAIILQAILL